MDTTESVTLNTPCETDELVDLQTAVDEYVSAALGCENGKLDKLRPVLNLEKITVQSIQSGAPSRISVQPIANHLFVDLYERILIDNTETQWVRCVVCGTLLTYRLRTGTGSIRRHACAKHLLPQTDQDDGGDEEERGSSAKLRKIAEKGSFAWNVDTPSSSTVSPTTDDERAKVKAEMHSSSPQEQSGPFSLLDNSVFSVTDVVEMSRKLLQNSSSIVPPVPTSTPSSTSSSQTDRSPTNATGSVSRLLPLPSSTSAVCPPETTETLSNANFLPFSRMFDCELNFALGLGQELREMTPLQRDLVKLRIRQIILEVKHANPVTLAESVQQRDGI